MVKAWVYSWGVGALRCLGFRFRVSFRALGLRNILGLLQHLLDYQTLKGFSDYCMANTRSTTWFGIRLNLELRVLNPKPYPKLLAFKH